MTDERTTPPPPSRREANKRQTREALQRAALELCAANGYDATTIDEIAERAGVSPRTFFRYFPTKNSALFAGEHLFFEAFNVVHLDQPSSLSDVEALRATLVALTPGLAQARESLALLERAAASSPTLRGAIEERQDEDIVALARTIAHRRGVRHPDERALLLANIGIMVMAESVREWLRGPADGDPVALVERRFDLLGELFAPW